MDQKITRRAVLGSAIAGLAIAPFVVHAWRKGRQKELQGLSETEMTREACIDAACKINGASRNQMERVIAVFLAEKEKWLKFRELHAGVSCSLQGQEGSESEQFSMESAGYIRFTASRPGAPSNQNGRFSWDICLKYFEEKGGKEKYSYSVTGNGSSPEFTGEPVAAVDYSTVFELLSLPLTFFTQFLLLDNVYVPGMFASGSYKIKSLGTGGEKDDFSSFVMVSSQEHGGFSSSFKDGLFHGMHGISEGAQQPIVMSMEKYASAGDVLFPTQFKMDLKGGESQKQISFTMLLSDVEVTLSM